MRLIDADALEKSICQDKCGLEECCMTFERDGAEYCLEVQRVKDAPTIDAEPVRHGKWIWVEDVPLEDGETEYDREAWYQCSECDAYDLRLKDCHSDYCWSCGAKMDLDEVNDEAKDT